MFEETLKQRLHKQHEQGLYRQRLCRQSPQQNRIKIAKKVLHNFASNDYLGLANDDRIKQAIQEALNSGYGSGASQVVSGYHAAHQALEEAIAEFTGRDRALVFSTGFMANLSVLTTLANKSSIIFQDKLNHASLIDGALFSDAKMIRYKHKDLQDLKKRLVVKPGQLNFLVSDGVFSCQGDIAPASELVDCAKENNLTLMLDDAHGLGVLGRNGGGCTESFHLSQQDVPILVGTFGKAFGGFGAFVAGSEALIETLIQFARPYVYTTAMPVTLAKANLKSLQILKSEHWRREKLHGNIALFKQFTKQLDIATSDSQTAIQSIYVGDAKQSEAIGAYLQEHGYLIGVMRPPTVPPNQSCLRITLSAMHSDMQINGLLQTIQKLRKPNG